VASDPKSDFSLNRCTAETSPMLPDKFKLGKTTPKSMNDFSGSRFVIETNIIRLTEPLTRGYDPLEDAVMELAEEAQCSSRLTIDEYYSLSNTLVHRAIQTDIDMAKMNSFCSAFELGGDDTTTTGDNSQTITLADNSQKEMTGQTPVREWKTTKFFQNSWLIQIERYQKAIMPIKTIENNRLWFEYLPDRADPTQSKYRCRLCSRHFSKFGIDQRFKSALAEQAGVLHKDYKSNWQAITDHGRHKQHLAIIARLE